jgi:hypothetical protein
MSVLRALQSTLQQTAAVSASARGDSARSVTVRVSLSGVAHLGVAFDSSLAEHLLQQWLQRVAAAVVAAAVQLPSALSDAVRLELESPSTDRGGRDVGNAALLSAVAGSEAVKSAFGRCRKAVAKLRMQLVTSVPTLLRVVTMDDTMSVGPSAGAASGSASRESPPALAAVQDALLRALRLQTVMPTGPRAHSPSGDVEPEPAPSSSPSTSRAPRATISALMDVYDVATSCTACFDALRSEMQAALPGESGAQVAIAIAVTGASLVFARTLAQALPAHHTLLSVAAVRCQRRLRSRMALRCGDSRIPPSRLLTACQSCTDSSSSHSLAARGGLSASQKELQAAASTARAAGAGAGEGGSHNGSSSPHTGGSGSHPSRTAVSTVQAPIPQPPRRQSDRVVKATALAQARQTPASGAGTELGTRAGECGYAGHVCRDASVL